MLDTNVCVRVIRERPRFIRARFNAEATGLSLSTIALAELLFGAAESNQPIESRNEVDRLTARLDVLNFDTDAAGHAADIRATLERQGRAIGPNDTLIAGHARSRGLIVVTGNLGEFQRVDGLRCEDWLGR